MTSAWRWTAEVSSWWSLKHVWAGPCFNMSWSPDGRMPAASLCFCSLTSLVCMPHHLQSSLSYRSRLPGDRHRSRCSLLYSRNNRHCSFRWHQNRTYLTHFYRAMHFSAKRGIAITCRLSVRLSVTLVNCDHIGWNSSKIIPPLVSLGRSLFATPTWRVCSKGNTPKFSPE